MRLNASSGIHHPKDHRRQDGDGDEHRDALENLLAKALEFDRRGEQARGDPRTREEGDDGPRVHVALQRDSSDLDQIAEDDADDKRRLNTFPNADDQARNNPYGGQRRVAPGFVRPKSIPSITL